MDRKQKRELIIVACYLIACIGLALWVMRKYRDYSEEWLLNSRTYGEHASAMTSEKLHSKSDIAAELAWRDDQLAKANERVRECHEELVNRHNQIQELRQENGEYAILIANLVRRADVKTDLLQNPTFEKASEQLNKFAIEKQLETAKKCAFGSTSWVLEHIKFLEEQLRKEQEHG